MGNLRHGRHIWIVLGRSSGGDSEDSTEDLRAFNQAMAMQATDDQVAIYSSMVKETETALGALQTLAGQSKKGSNTSQSSASTGTLSQAIEMARSESRQFVASLSKAQALGLRDITVKLNKLDAELAEQSAGLKVSTETTPDAAPIENAKTLGQTLSAFHTEQLGLGNEMGIQDIGGAQAFTLDILAVNSTLEIEKKTVAMTIQGTISRGSTDVDHNQLTLQLVADASDLQESITEILRAKLDGGQRCGDRLYVRWATLAAQELAVTLRTQLQVQRWTCYLSSNLGEPQELVEGTGGVELKVTPTIEANNQVRLVAEVSKVDNTGLVADQIRSGTLGAALRTAAVQALTPAVGAEMDFKTVLPPAAQNSVTARKIEFREAGGLRILLDGDIPISDDQIRALITQLRNRQTAQGSPQQ